MMATVFNQVGPYEILHEIGRGGMAVVFLARDTRTDSPVALKLVAQGTDREAREVLEAEQWTHFVELLDRSPQDNPGLEKLFSKPSVFAAE